jgi:hypothetical protein
MCASEADSEGSGAETMVYVISEGMYFGEYVAACSSGGCDYWGAFHWLFQINDS